MPPIEKIIVLGGGTAGYMSAAALAVATQGSAGRKLDIVLIESSSIGIIGVGEATLPSIKMFNNHIGLDEKEFIEATNASFKLGIEFKNWGHIGNRYFHPFGDYGPRLEGISAYQYWRKACELGDDFPLEDYSIASVLARNGKFFPPDPNPNSPLHNFDYAFHFDASLYARHLKEHCIKLGVKIIDAKVTQVSQNNETGFIEALELDNGIKQSADFFVDCTGFHGVLIEKTLKTGYQSWRHLLPADSAIAIPCKRTSQITPYTTSTAHEGGWQWRIPLQHRTGNGIVYSREFWSDDNAHAALLANLDGEILAEPNHIRFETGHRKQFWNKNCICIGLASGFLEPLESTSINFIQTGIARFLDLFPSRNFSQHLQNEYNRLTQIEYNTIRDFIITHYKLNTRKGEPLWDYCANLEVPESVKAKHEMFAHRGEVIMFEHDAFSEPSWVSIMSGQGLYAENYNPLIARKTDKEILDHLGSIRRGNLGIVDELPSHNQFISKYCASDDLKKSPYFQGAK